MNSNFEFVLQCGLFIIAIVFLYKFLIGIITGCRNYKLDKLKKDYEFDKEFISSPVLAVNTKTGDIIVGFNEAPFVINIKDVVTYEMEYLNVSGKNAYTTNHTMKITTNTIQHPLIRITPSTPLEAKNMMAIFDILRSRS